MKNKIVRGLFVCTVAVVFLCGVGATESPAKDKIRIGQAIALSGPLAGGVAIAGGRIYVMWVEEVNKRGGIYVKEYGKRLPVELIRYSPPGVPRGSLLPLLWPTSTGIY
jgi:hypothetical protein